MRASISAAEMGLALIFMSRCFTRIFQKRAIALYGFAGARVSEIPGSGVVPPWVSLLSVVGWSIALVAGPWLVVDTLLA